jgi:3-hydroxymyristoyl/3-hydroxydecanoyl-(acyl carrier protein) dehydratase
MTEMITLHVDADHPAFRGHFPGRPIVPGVLLLEWAIDAIAVAEQRALLPGKLLVAKFLNPVGPAAQLEIHYRIESAAADIQTHTVNFAITATGRKIATATFVSAGAPAA